MTWRQAAFCGRYLGWQQRSQCHGSWTASAARKRCLASGGGGSTETDGNLFQALVNIAGPISRIEIVHTKGNNR